MVSFWGFINPCCVAWFACCTDPNKHGASYFLYTNNEVAVDIGAQLDYIHEAKCAELGVTRVQTATMASAGQRSGADMSTAGGIRAAAAAQHRPWHLQPDTLMSSLARMQDSWMASYAVQRSGRPGDVWTVPRSSAGPHLRPSTSEGNLLHVGTSPPSHRRCAGQNAATAGINKSRGFVQHWTVFVACSSLHLLKRAETD